MRSPFDNRCGELGSRRDWTVAQISRPRIRASFKYEGAGASARVRPATRPRKRQAELREIPHKHQQTSTEVHRPTTRQATIGSQIQGKPAARCTPRCTTRRGCCPWSLGSPGAPQSGGQSRSSRHRAHVPRHCCARHRARVRQHVARHQSSTDRPECTTIEQAKPSTSITEQTQRENNQCRLTDSPL